MLAAPDVARVLISQARHKMYNDVVITLELYIVLHPVYP